jgi:hypothetical protein
MKGDIEQHHTQNTLKKMMVSTIVSRKFSVQGVRWKRAPLPETKRTSDHQCIKLKLFVFHHAS